MLPTSFYSGDSLKWDASFPDYPAPTWALTYTLNLQITPTTIYTVTATANGTGFSVSVSPAVSATWTAGTYSYVARVSNGTNVFTVDTGIIKVLPNPATATTDLRSHARRTLAAIEATIEGRASHAELEFSAFGRTLKYCTLAELITARNKYKTLVASEDAALAVSNGLSDPNNCYVRFI
jgi:hypothetical protein